MFVQGLQHINKQTILSVYIEIKEFLQKADHE